MKLSGARRLLALALVTLVAGACEQADRHLLAYGPPATFDSVKISAYADQQANTVVAISKMAGTEGRTPKDAAEWRSFVLAGIELVDSQCNEYLGALDRFYRAKNATTQQLALAGAATIGILGVVGAAASAVAITGIAFGLASASVDNVSKGLIYDLPPTAVAQLVKEMQRAYKGAMAATIYTDRPSAFLALRGYIEICLPVNIETQVANAVKVAKVEAKPGLAGLPPTVQVGPITATTFGIDDNTRLLKAWAYKEDAITLSSENRDKLRAAMNRAGLPATVSIVAFLNSAQYQEQRAAVVKDLNL